MLKEEVSKQISEVFKLQEERVHIWNDFDTSFKEYLLDAPNFNFKTLQVLCKRISEALNEISMKILTIKNNFSENVYNRKNVYELIESLQTNERVKFELVGKLYKQFIQYRLV